MRGSPSRAPVDPVVEARGAVAAAQRVHHVDAGLAERPLQVGGALLVGPGQVAVHLAVVGPEDDPVPARLEVGGRLLDPRARLRRARRRDDRDRRLLGQGRRLDARASTRLRRDRASRDALDRLGDQLAAMPAASRAPARRAARRPARASAGRAGRTRARRPCTGAGSRRWRRARPRRAASRRGCRRGSCR